MQPRNRQEIGLYLTGDVSPLMTTYELIKLLLVEVNVHYPSPHDCLIYKKDAQITGEYPDPDCILSWPILSEIIVTRQKKEHVWRKILEDAVTQIVNQLGSNRRR